ncbi:MAG TPA: type II secretion system protein GspL [Steroidobacteraceae bacterium]|nr:type II secretion system protein GspL [Steroidobacteraceae bacterium]
MADTLLIRLARQHDAAVSWLVADANGRVVLPPQRGSLMQAAGYAPGRRLCVIAPAPDVVLTDVEVPIKSGTKVQQLVPFALEEQLAEDIETVHFAVGKRSAEAVRTPVAVVARTLIEQWLAGLREAGLDPEFLYPESELLPLNPGQTVALLDQPFVTVRPAGALPTTLPLDALPEALALAEQRGAGAPSPLERTGSGLVLYTGAAEWQHCSRQVETVRDRFDGIKVQLLTDGPLVLFATQLPRAATQAINLLQGSYAPASRKQSGWRAWRVAALLLVGLVVLHAAGSAAELMMLKRSEHKLDASIEAAFRAAMPAEHTTAHARQRMEQRLIELRGGGSANGLLGALGALAQARGATPGVIVQALSFREGALEMKLSAPNVEALDHISQALQASGWQAQLTSGNAAGSAYEGRIQIKPRV